MRIKGYTIIVTARTQQKCNETVEKLKSKVIKAFGMELNVENNDLDNVLILVMSNLANWKFWLIMPVYN